MTKMTYKIEIRKNALKFIQKQDRTTQKRLLKGINGLPNIGDIRKMAGYKSLYRLRIGDFRVLYELDPQSDELTLIDVSDIDSRGQIYK